MTKGYWFFWFQSVYQLILLFLYALRINSVTEWVSPPLIPLTTIPIFLFGLPLG
jgi:hypothetical protein